MNTKNTPQVAVVGGLHFRFSRLRGRRCLRGGASLVALLGPVGAALFTGGHANNVTADMLLKVGGLVALANLITQDQYRDGAQLSNPDVVEDVANEVLVFASGQGTEISGDGVSWMPIRSIDTFASWEAMGLGEILDVLWRALIFNFFGSVAPAIKGGMAPADATTTQGAPSDGKTTMNGGQTSPQTGVVSG